MDANELPIVRELEHTAKTFAGKQLGIEAGKAAALIVTLYEALWFYGDESTYKSATVHMCGHSSGSKLEADGGSIARAVLAETNGDADGLP